MKPFDRFGSRSGWPAAALIALCLVTVAFGQSFQESFDRARELLKQKQFGQALEESRRAIHLDPSRWEGWFAAGTAIGVAASPSSTEYQFNGWLGNGSGSISQSLDTGTITVNGPIHEVASFIAVAPPATTTHAFLNTAPAWGILAAVGLVVGIGIGFAMFRGSGGRPTAPAPAAPARGSPEAADEEPESGEPAAPEFVEDQGGDQ